MTEDDEVQTRVSLDQIHELRERVKAIEAQLGVLASHLKDVRSEMLEIENAWQHKLISDR